MKYKAPLWMIMDAGPEDNFNATKEEWQKCIALLDKCWRKPTLNSAIRYAHKVADESNHPVIIQPRRNHGKKRCRTIIVPPKSISVTARSVR